MKFEVAYFDKLSMPFMERQEDIDLYVLKKIAQRIKEIKNLSTTDLNTLQQYLRSNNDIFEIEYTLAKLFQQQKDNIKSIITTAARDSYNECKPLFAYKKEKFIPFDDYSDIQDLVTLTLVALSTVYDELSSDIGFNKINRVINKKQSNTSIIPIAKTYSDILDIAIQAKRTPKIDFNLSIRPYIQQLIDSRLKTNIGTQTNPHIRNFDTASNNLITNNIKDIILAIQNKVADILGADGKELSAHLNSAPDHEPAQGHQFTNEEFEKMQSGRNFVDLQGRFYVGFERPIGAWNCRHITRSIFCGKTKPWYTDEELQKIIDDNAKGYTFPDGKHLTMYECTQQQRRMEAKIRHLKKACIVTDILNDEVLSNKYRTQIANEMAKYNSFSKACGLSPQYKRTAVKDYK